MGDVAERARELVSLLEAGAIDDVVAQVAGEVRRDLAPGALTRWAAGIERAVGSMRAITSAEAVDDRCARVLLSGERGTFAVTVRVDQSGMVLALGVGAWVEDGIRNIVIGCPFEERADRRLADFYAAVLDLRIVREDWLKLGKDLATFPHLAFGDGWEDARPPQWRDPEYPHQVHLEGVVGDLEAAASLAVAAGGVVLERREGHTIVADPFGHPVYLRLELGMSPQLAGGDDGPHAKLAAVTLQCADPEEVASFWSVLLGMPLRQESSRDRIVIASSPDRLMLAFERVRNYVAPRWHDPDFPEQIHLDLHFNEPDAARRRAEDLGAVALPPPRGSCPVYADPAGHPFCLCSSGGAETVPYLPVIGT